MFRIQRLRESLQRIADSKVDKSWRKPEIVQEAEFALKRDLK
jgi:hypothetical protein